MNIYNNISSYQNTLNYSQEQISNKNKQSSVKIDFQNVKYTQTSTDQVNLSKRTRGIGSLSLDKGTAANTTLYVDKNTFNNIVSYSTNNDDCKWDELGVDGEKRWVVINGQRFECPLSKEEKEAYKNASKTILDYIIEAEQKKEEKESKEKNKTDINVNSNGEINLSGNSQTFESSKIKNLLNNDKVMTMLKDIASLNGGTISLWQ